MEAFISMRMNDLHQNGIKVRNPMGKGDFWLDHPEFWIGKGITPMKKYEDTSLILSGNNVATMKLMDLSWILCGHVYIFRKVKA